MSRFNPRTCGSSTMSGSRRCCGAVTGTIVSRCANRRFLFAIATWSVFAAKAVHIYAHFPALSTEDIIRWGFSFFSQDVALLLVIRFLLDKPLFGAVPFIRIIFPTLASFIIFILWGLSTIQCSFFITAGSEPHWRNAMDVAGEAAAGKMMLAGLTWFLIVFGIMIAVSWVTQDLIHYFTTIALEIIKFPFAFVWSKTPLGRRTQKNVKYAEISQQESEGFLEGAQKEEDYHSETDETNRPRTKLTVASYVFVGFCLACLFFQYFFRPENESLLFMSWTLPMLPLVDFTHSSPTLANLLPVHGTSINYAWDERSALDDPIKFKWLPKEKLQGWEDWYEKDKKHYRGKSDPMRLSNLENDLLPELKDKLLDVDIRHVMLIKLESTRKDVFPIKKDSYIWQKLSNSYSNKSLPYETAQRLASLTPTANFLTGDYNDGFPHAEQKKRGGLSMNNVHTTSTYTLKSMTGTFCGISPIVADFNIEWQNHIYQPCLPQIFDAFNHIDHSKDNATEAIDYVSMPWMSQFMQSVTGGYDKQDRLMPALGFPIENIFTMEYLKGDGAKFGKPDFDDINYYGMPEYAIEPYLRDAFQTAKKENKRVFLGHLTSTSHHPFGIPKDQKFVSMSEDKGLQELSKYLNAIGYVDTWLQNILNILEEEGVADETLLVFVGDHGLSIAENGGVTPYFGPNIGNFHVPMVLSHPKLPPITIDDAVSSIQILPTILDLLLETGSLSDSEGAAALDLLKNYEGQSLIRPMIKHSEKQKLAQWQYTVMNPGRAQLAVRDGRNPDWRLVVPIVDDIEWRYTDLQKDPHEKHGIRTFGFKKFLTDVEAKYGADAAHWCEEAAFMSRWWVEDNSKRWRYDPK